MVCVRGGCPQSSVANVWDYCAVGPLPSSVLALVSIIIECATFFLEIFQSVKVNGTKAYDAPQATHKVWGPWHATS